MQRTRTDENNVSCGTLSVSHRQHYVCVQAWVHLWFHLCCVTSDQCTESIQSLTLYKNFKNMFAGTTYVHVHVNYQLHVHALLIYASKFRNQRRSHHSS